MRAPLEQPANPALTPNPAKAPWYFLGLQELLVFSDAWLVGVIVPCAAMLGLMAIPYLDFNPQGSGYYTIRQRRFATAVFLFGFLMLGILPILIGDFLRGPNWSAFGPFEAHDPGKLPAAHNVTLAEWFWTSLLGRPCRRCPHTACWAAWARSPRGKSPAWSLLAAYFLALPPLLRPHVAGQFPPPHGPRAALNDDLVAAVDAPAAAEDAAAMELRFELPGEHPGMVVFEYLTLSATKRRARVMLKHNLRAEQLRMSDEQTFYNTKRLHAVFALSAAAFLAATVCGVLVDARRPWKQYQRTFHERIDRACRRPTGAGSRGSSRSTFPTCRAGRPVRQLGRVDRCTTCHRGSIARAGGGSGRREEPYRGHPRLDLFVGQHSPHPHVPLRLHGLP